MLRIALREAIDKPKGFREKADLAQEILRWWCSVVLLVLKLLLLMLL